MKSSPGDPAQGLRDGPSLSALIKCFRVSKRCADLLETDVLRLKCNYRRARRNSPEVESGCMATSRICSSNVTSVSLARSWGPLSDHTDTQNKRRVAPSEQNQGWPPQRKSYLQKTTATRETLIGMSYLTKPFTFCLSYQCKKWIMTPSQPLLTKTVVNNMIKVFNLPSQFNALYINSH